MRKLIALIQRLTAGRFFGSVTLRFESGRLLHVKVKQILKASDLG